MNWIIFTIFKTILNLLQDHLQLSSRLSIINTNNHLKDHLGPLQDHPYPSLTFFQTILNLQQDNSQTYTSSTLFKTIFNLLLDFLQPSTSRSSLSSFPNASLFTWDAGGKVDKMSILERVIYNFYHEKCNFPKKPQLRMLVGLSFWLSYYSL